MAPQSGFEPLASLGALDESLRPPGLWRLSYCGKMWVLQALHLYLPLIQEASWLSFPTSFAGVYRRAKRIWASYHLRRRTLWSRRALLSLPLRCHLSALLIELLPQIKA